MKPDPSRLRQQISRIERSREDHVHGILQQRGPLRSGSLVTIRRKCGKPNCHCATGEGHLTTYLSTREGGKTRMVYVTAALSSGITREAQRYRRVRRHRAVLAKLSQQSLQLIDQLQAALQTTAAVCTVSKGTSAATGRKKRR